MLDKLTSLVIDLIERGWFPDRLTRALSRRLCKTRLRQLQNSGVDPTQFAERMRVAAIAPVPEKANEQHYELPPEFFQLMLGPRLKYSCCFFEGSRTTLAEAEIDALDQTIQRAQLADGMSILELGCGWGSLTLWMLEKFPQCRVTAVSNSAQQRQLIMSRAREAGVEDRLTVKTADMNDFDTAESFDRVVSCEMFEHMRNYRLLLARIARWLKPDGKLFVHIFCHRDYIYEFETAGAANWMGRYFFTGGIMPNAGVFRQFTDNMQVVNSWDWDGTHYERTCNAWLEKLDQNRDAALQILQAAYGAGEAERWFQRWRLFLIAGAELFGFQQGSQWQVGHYLLEPQSTAVPGAELLATV